MDMRGISVCPAYLRPAAEGILIDDGLGMHQRHEGWRRSARMRTN
jgi:hypothetical protein